MKITKIKKVYSYKLQSKLKEALITKELDYRTRQFFDDICDEGIYKYDYTETIPKLRITFPFFLLIILFANIFATIKWLFTGNVRFSEKWWFTKSMVKWDKYCGFNIV